MSTAIQADVEPILVTMPRLGATGKPIQGIQIDLAPVRVLLRRIVEEYAPEEVWLFGSRARGDAREGSDWDLIVLLRDDCADADLEPERAWGLQLGSGVYADVIPCRITEFREASDWVNTLAYVVAREGVRVHAR